MRKRGAATLVGWAAPLARPGPSSQTPCRHRGIPWRPPLAWEEVAGGQRSVDSGKRQGFQTPIA